MAKDNPHPGTKADVEDVIDLPPNSKRGKAGQMGHDDERAGANSADSGKVQAPQKGDPHSDDRMG